MKEIEVMFLWNKFKGVEAIKMLIELSVCVLFLEFSESLPLLSVWRGFIKTCIDQTTCYGYIHFLAY